MIAQHPTDSIPTTERLAQALEALGDPKLEPIITRARQGVYDDFKTDLPYPAIQLVKDLTELGHEAFAERVKDGEFDATMAEAEAWLGSADGLAGMLKTQQGEPAYKLKHKHERKQSDKQAKKRGSNAQR